MVITLAYRQARDVSKCKGWDIEAVNARGVIFIEVRPVGPGCRR
jgi:hypothetical protein